MFCPSQVVGKLVDGECGVPYDGTMDLFLTSRSNHLFIFNNPLRPNDEVKCVYR